MRLKQIITLYRTVISLGLLNTAIVILYRLAARTHILKNLQPINSLSISFSSLINQPEPAACDLPDVCREKLLAQSKDLIDGYIRYFSNHEHQVGNPAEWLINPWQNKRFPDAKNHWSILRDFSGGDIKICWELSRWEWAPLLIRSWRISGDPIYFQTWENWCNDWNYQNPSYGGPNWKCGQECSIRLINGLLAAYLGNIRPEDLILNNWVLAHCKRISSTIYYAIAQNNNHGTSEAAGLFIGGLWLSHSGMLCGKYWHSQGRYWLENRVASLVMKDGSFSQNSLTYHRVLLDTLCQAEWWRRHFNQPPFSDSFYNRTKAAIDWLWNFIDQDTGDGPNLGSNDGAKLFALHSCSYRDFRPTLQMATSLFYNQRWLTSGSWDEPLAWLNVSVPLGRSPLKQTHLYQEGGYAILRPKKQRTWGLLRLPNYRFRPSHADALHFDLWVDGKNILRDGGTFSYNTEFTEYNYFKGTGSHNTVQFDCQDQMPSLGRFLFGDWLQPLEPPEWGDTWVQCSYKNAKGHFHRRRVSFQQNNGWQIEDEVSGWKHQATLRWRLIPGEWQLLTNGVTGLGLCLKIESSLKPRTLQLIEGRESLRYLEQNSLPVLEVEFDISPVRIVTTIVIL